MNQKIIDFYTGNGTDDQGRTLEDILLWDSDELEQTHDYIQWLFPLTEPSRFNPNAPLFDEETIEAFTANKICMKNIVRALERMLDFYELRKRKDGIRTIPGKLGSYRNIKATKPWWVENGDHNYLRFTRILTCLNHLGLYIYTEMVYQLLTDLYEVFADDIGATTMQFWYAAAFKNDESGEADPHHYYEDRTYHVDTRR